MAIRADQFPDVRVRLVTEREWLFGGEECACTEKEH